MTKNPGDLVAPGPGWVAFIGHCHRPTFARVGPPTPEIKFQVEEMSRRKKTAWLKMDQAEKKRREREKRYQARQSKEQRRWK